MSHKVFISYSDKDHDVAQAVCEALEGTSIGCWMAPRDIPPGQHYPRAIVSAIEAAQVMVLIYSSNSNASRHVMGELDQAFSENVTLMPFRIEDVEPVRELQYFLRTSQWMDAFTGPLEQHVPVLVEAVRLELDRRLHATDTGLRATKKSRPPSHAHGFGTPPSRPEEPAPSTLYWKLAVAALLLVITTAATVIFFYPWQPPPPPPEPPPTPVTAPASTPAPSPTPAQPAQPERGKALEEAKAARIAAGRMKRAAERLDAAGLAPEAWAEGERLWNLAEAAFGTFVYSDARENWDKAAKAYASAVTEAGRLVMESDERTEKDLKDTLRSLHEVQAHIPENQDAVTLGEGVTELLTITNSIGMKLVYLPPGDFFMGSPPDEVKGKKDKDELRHQRIIDRTVYMGAYEVTRGQFARFIEETGYVTLADKSGSAWIRTDGFPAWQKVKFGPGERYIWNSPNFAQDDDHPVVLVTWHDANAFCQWLSKKENRRYRLPTEPEWEYACRAGTATPFNRGPTITADMANFCGEKTYPPGEGQQGLFRKKTLRGGSFPANRWGVFDMHGNVWEWCNDPYIETYPTDDDEEVEIAPENVEEYVRRGGGWASSPITCRSANRWKLAPDVARSDTGFRVVLVPSE